MALISEFLYQHLLDWLCPAMEAEYKRLYSKGKDGGKLMERWEAWAVVEGIGKDGIDKEQCIIVEVEPIKEK